MQAASFINDSCYTIVVLSHVRKCVLYPGRVKKFLAGYKIIIQFCLSVSGPKSTQHSHEGCYKMRYGIFCRSVEEYEG